MVKRLWTASFTFLSAGWVLLAHFGDLLDRGDEGLEAMDVSGVSSSGPTVFLFIPFSQVLRGWLARNREFYRPVWFLGPWARSPMVCWSQRRCGISATGCISARYFSKSEVVEKRHAISLIGWRI